MPRIPQLISLSLLSLLAISSTYAQTSWHCTHAPFNARAIITIDQLTPIIHSSTLLRKWDALLNEWNITPLTDDSAVSESGFVHSLDGNFYFTTMDGRVFKSLDGTSFEVIGTPIEFAEPEIFDVNNNVIFVAHNSYGQVSVNDGLSWTLIIQPPFQTVWDCAVSPSGRLLIAQTNALKFSDDLGQNWITGQVPGNTTVLFQPFLNDSVLHVIRLNDKALLRSSNNGEVFSETGVSGILATSFYSATNGIALSDNTVYHTSDAGVSWSSVLSNNMPTSPQFVSFNDSLNGYIINPNQVYKTADGGLNWELMPPSWIPGLQGGNSFLGDGDNWYAIGGTSSAFTQNNGISWTTLSTQFDNKTGVVFHHNQVFTAHQLSVTAQLPLKTENAGTSWDNMNANVTSIDEIEYVSESNVWIRNGSTIRKTTNGSSWSNIPYMGGSVKSFSRLNADTALVLITNPNSFPYYALRKTVNNGASFSSLGESSLEGLQNDYKMRFYNADTGVIYRNSNTLWITNDGGSTFLQQNVEPPVGFSSISQVEFLSATHLLLRRSDGSLMESLDGGLTWGDKGNIFRTAGFAKLNVFNDRATILGSGGILLQSRDVYNEPPVEQLVGDLNQDQVVNVNDLLLLLNDWGCNENCEADLTNDGIVNAMDLLALIGYLE